MATKVVMEALSPTMEEGRLVEWKKQEGDTVAQGDVLAEVETDKAVMDLVARAGGTLLKQLIAAGTTAPVSSLVAVIGEPNEDIAALIGGQGGAKTEPKPAGDASMPPAPAAEAATETYEASQAPAMSQGRAPAADGGRVKASPLARKIAADRGLDLQRLEGTGPQGRIVQRDVVNAAAPTAPTAPTRPAAGPAAPKVPAFVPAGTGEPYQDVPLSQMRKTIARRLAQSIGPVPTFYLTIEVDMERAAEAREALNALGEGKVSFNDIIIKATASALKQHPMCNAWWQDDHMRLWNEVHISMAVAIDEGLITPVIRYADQKSLRQISAESKDLAARARERRLAPEEYTGGTFSISNLGMLDIEEFTAIINPPEAGILAIGRMVEKPVVTDGVIDTRRRMRITMSCDHRVIDGATGARFLGTLKTMLENPLALVW